MRDPGDVMRRHAHSFHWAAALMSGPTARDAAVLYTFCRAVDDLADTLEPAAAAAALDRIADDLTSGADAREPAAGLLQLAAAHAIPIEAAQTLVAGARADIEAPQLATVDQLVQYCYRVAGTVGLMMCPLLGVRRDAALPFAVDLGIAMQLTNLARDVVEDANHGRRYLPSEYLGAAVAPARLVHPDETLRRDAYAAVISVLDLAERYYANAELGMADIPRRSRLAIMTAARVYHGIGDRIRRVGAQRFWLERAAVPATGKAVRTVGAIGAAMAPRSARIATVEAHDAALHAALAGWPGTDPRADSH
jgi:phytoene synthase